jgi:hypothetical protein
MISIPLHLQLIEKQVSHTKNQCKNRQNPIPPSRLSAGEKERRQKAHREIQEKKFHDE